MRLRVLGAIGQHVVERLTLAAANVQKEALKKKAEYFNAHARELELVLAQEPTPTSAALIIDVDVSILSLLEYEYRMANVEAIRVAEEASSANLKLRFERWIDSPLKSHPIWP